MPKIRKRNVRLQLESLEDRRVPATWGVPWADPQHLTVSFVPDGTSMPGGGTSQLFQTLDSQLGSASGWETSILKALQTWAATSNINIGVVADGGEPLGVAGPAQGDARFGDIRISAEPLPSDVVAITTPYSPGNGTLSGDIILNSNDDFKPADSGSYDLFTIALHEAGHVFGFADSTDPSNFMYNVYQGPVTGLASGAVPALQALYGGPRNIDGIDNIPNSSSASDPVNIPNPSGNSTSVSLPGDLATAQTSNYFSFQAPNSLLSLLGETLDVNVSVQTAGLSLLTPKVTVYNAFGGAVATASASGPLAGGTSVHFIGLLAGEKYTVQVQGATGDAFSIGSYDLNVSTALSSLGASSPTANSHPFQEPSNYNGSVPLTVGDSITGTNQVDVYSFKAPAALNLSGMTINLQDWGVGLVAPTVTVYSLLGLEVGSATASSAANPSVSLHIGLVLPSTTYYVQVTDGLVNPIDFGTYQASVSFTSGSSSSSGTFVPATPWFGTAAATSTQANGTIQTAATLQTPAFAATDSVYDAIDGLDPAQPEQFFGLTTPNASNGQPEVMTVSVQTLGNGGMLPSIGVFDQNGNALNAQILTDENGVAVVQVALPNPGARYYVAVSASPFGGTSNSGNFVLNATFGSQMAIIGPIMSGNLAASPAGSPTAQVSTSLTIGQGELYSLILSGSPTNPPTDAILQMNLLDSSGNVVATLSTPANQAESMILCLPAGIYTVEVDAYSPSGEAIPSLEYSLAGTNLTDPIKVTPTSGSGGASGGNPSP